MSLFRVSRKTDPCPTTQSGSKPFQFSKELPLSQLRIQSELFSKLTETFNLSFNIPLTTEFCHRTWVWGLLTAQRTIHCPHCRPLWAWTWNLKLNWPLLSLQPRAGRSTEQYFRCAKLKMTAHKMSILTRYWSIDVLNMQKLRKNSRGRRWHLSYLMSRAIEEVQILILFVFFRLEF